MKQETYYVVDSLGVAHPETIDVQPWTLSRFFVEGGMTGMILISLMLIALFLAAWKAPRWVKEIGSFALVFGFLGMILAILQLLGDLQTAGSNLPSAVIYGGLKVTLIPVIYGAVIYLISLVVRVIQKPRL